MKKKFKTILVMVLVIITLSSATCFAGNDDISVYVNGMHIASEVSPVIENGYTLMPMRDILEALGYYVEWHDDTKEVYAIYNFDGDYTICYTVKINNVEASKFDLVGYDIQSRVDFQMDAPARMINGKTMVPIRFFAEAVGYTVDWDAASKTVSIYNDYYNSEYNYYNPETPINTDPVIDNSTDPYEITDEQKAINEQYTHIFDDGETGDPDAIQ